MTSAELFAVIAITSLIVQWVTEYVRFLIGAEHLDGSWVRITALVVSGVVTGLWRFGGSVLIDPVGDISLLDSFILLIGGAAGAGSLANLNTFLKALKLANTPSENKGA